MKGERVRVEGYGEREGEGGTYSLSLGVGGGRSLIWSYVLVEV